MVLRSWGWGSFIEGAGYRVQESGGAEDCGAMRFETRKRRGGAGEAWEVLLTAF
jgi:hypothetical protein